MLKRIYRLMYLLLVHRSFCAHDNLNTSHLAPFILRSALRHTVFFTQTGWTKYVTKAISYWGSAVSNLNRTEGRGQLWMAKKPQSWSQLVCTLPDRSIIYMVPEGPGIFTLLASSFAHYLLTPSFAPLPGSLPSKMTREEWKQKATSENHLCPSRKYQFAYMSIILFWHKNKAVIAPVEMCT